MKRMASVTMFTALITLYRIASSFIVAKVIAIYTGPAGLAMLGQTQSLFALINGIVISPAGNGLVRYTSENINQGYESCARWWKASIFYAIIFLFTISPFLFFFQKQISLFLFQEESYSWIAIAIIIALPCSLINTAFISVLNGQQQFRSYFLVSFISISLSTLVVFFLVYHYMINGAILAAVINTSISGFVILVISLKRDWVKFEFWIGLPQKKYLSDILKYIIMAVTAAIAAPLSLMLIRKLLVVNVGWSITGEWQAVWKISEVYLSVITIALSTYYLPQLSKLKSAEDIKKEIANALKVVLPVVVILALMVYLLRDIIVHVLFTGDFYEARNYFSVQLVGDVIKIISWLYAFPMLSKGAVKWFVSSEIFFSITFVLFSYFLISMLGAHGANWAYLINYSLYLIFVFFNLNNIICFKGKIKEK